MAVWEQRFVRIKPASDEDIDETLRLWGENGWEVVGLAPAGHVYRTNHSAGLDEGYVVEWVFTFKRPKSP
ncbi:hypothetical protein [Streptomyces sp. NPDC046853]|uniref:hypothetical protein n=1 Tax=unclassified Streptomyces TaxID=2593676 RepID=UPI0033E0558B